MHADVGKGLGDAAAVGIQPPVSVLGTGHPVLQVGTVDQVQVAGLPVGDTSARLAHCRVVAVDERHSGHGIAVAAAGEQVCSGVDVRGQWLLTDHVFARAQRRASEPAVQSVGHTDVHHVDIGGLDQLLGRTRRVRCSECGRSVLRAFRAGGGHVAQLGPRSADRMGVHASHEPATDDADLQ